MHVPNPAPKVDGADDVGAPNAGAGVVPKAPAGLLPNNPVAGVDATVVWGKNPVVDVAAPNAGFGALKIPAAFTSYTNELLLFFKTVCIKHNEHNSSQLS